MDLTKIDLFDYARMIWPKDKIDIVKAKSDGSLVTNPSLSDTY